MALKLSNILRLEICKGMEIAAGADGLSRIVSGLGIGDYEFASFSPETERDVFDPGMIVLSNLLFAKSEPGQILACVENLERRGAAALFYKNAIFDELPEEALRFADEKGFPIVKYSDLYMEELIFEFLSAIRAEEDNFFTEQKVDEIIREGLSRERLYGLCKGISLPLLDYAEAVYISSDSPEFQGSIERYLREVYLARELKTKLMLFRYRDGLFAILTSKRPEARAFDDILSMLASYMSLERYPDIRISKSDIYPPFSGLDRCVRESYETCLAGLADGRAFGSYGGLGMYRAILPLRENGSLLEYVNEIASAIGGEPEMADTANALVSAGGDIAKSAELLSCHPNTVRYRVSKLKKMLKLEDRSDWDFYAELSFALKAHRAANIGKS